MFLAQCIFGLFVGSMMCYVLWFVFFDRECPKCHSHYIKHNDECIAGGAYFRTVFCRNCRYVLETKTICAPICHI
ncbi:MAG: hypothetical protein Q7S37_04715 [bacterium]|nr:hypothetical protein [bacterium]